MPIMTPTGWHAMAIAVALWSIAYGCSFIPWLMLSSNERSDRIAAVVVWAIGVVTAMAGVFLAEWSLGRVVWS